MKKAGVRSLARLTLFVLTASLLSCGGDEAVEDSPTSQGQTLKVQAVATGTRATFTSSALRGASFDGSIGDDRYASAAIISGAPDYLKLYITYMALKSSSGSSGITPIFTNDSGAELVIRGSSVDISNFFTDIRCILPDGTTLDVECTCGVQADGQSPIEKVLFDDGAMGCPAEFADGELPPSAVLTVDGTGPFDTLEVRYRFDAKVKGCVRGHMRQTGWTGGDWATGGNTAEETYCTDENRTVNRIILNSETYTSSDFSSGNLTSGTEADILVGYNSSANIETGSFTIDYTLSEPISLGGETDPTITMLIDTSRILSFFKYDNYDNANYSRADGDYPTGSSYFFLRRLRDVNYIFVGEVGSISSLSWKTNGLAENTGTTLDGSEVPADYDCITPDTCNRFTKGGMTVVYVTDDNPIFVSLVPEDNNVGIKTSTRDDSDALSTTGGGVYNLKLNGIGYDYGTIYNLNLSKSHLDTITDGSEAFVSNFLEQGISRPSESDPIDTDHFGGIQFVKDY